MKLLLVEDDRVTANKLISDLNNHGYAIDLAADGETAFMLAISTEYDLILLDIIIPKIDGITVCQQLRQKQCHVPILLLTAKNSKADIVAGLNAGADDYLLKPYDLEELLARIKALLRRQRLPIVQVLTWGNICLDLVSGKVTCGERLVSLTPNEYRILEIFLRYPYRVFDRRTIIDRVWTFDEPPTERAINTHIKDLRAKLKQAGASGDPLETIRGMGYRLRENGYVKGWE
jgi:DNA-binding response OmpR family regulator